MAEVTLPFAAALLALLLTDRVRTALLLALPFLAAEYGIHRSITEVLHVPLITLLGWLPFARSGEEREALFQRRGATLRLFLRSLLAVPASVTLIVSTRPTFDLRLDDCLQTTLRLVTFTPLFFLLLRREEGADGRGRALGSRKGIAISLASLALALLIFGPILPANLRQLPISFLFFPILIASALKLPPLHHALNLALVVTLAWGGHLFGLGPFRLAPIELQEHLLQAFLLTLTWSTWLLHVQRQETDVIQSGLEDTTEERTKALKQSEAFLDALIENLPDMIFVKDARDLRFVRFNRAGETLIGVDRSAMIGRSDYDFFPKEQADHFTRNDRAILESRKIAEIEEPIATQKQGERWLKTRKLPLLDSAGNPQFILGISEDITMKREAERHRIRLIEEGSARREAEKNLALRNEFLAIAGHELRTPVAALKLAIDLGSRVLSQHDGLEHQHQLHQLFEILQLETRSLQHLTENLVDVSRIHEQRFRMSLRRNEDLSSLVRTTIDRLRGPLAEARCELQLDIHDGIRATFDPERITQLLEHVLLNAAKFGGGAPVTVRLASGEGSWELEVVDQGIGIDPDSLERLFHPFERATSYRNFPGLGLGLFISKEIMTAHHGRIRVDGSPGKGARFVFSAPIEPALSGHAA